MGDGRMIKCCHIHKIKKKKKRKSNDNDVDINITCGGKKSSGVMIGL